ncbi:MAG: sigma-70 family RNA polymerase sigma factor [Phycisphaeraceae bacterium]|nr:sigma-70 family RNA polymerase sigma factor [Phycisphaeraceae bacterium]
MSQLALLWGQAKPAVSAYVRSTVRNHHDAEDVIQSTVSQIAQRFDDYDPSRPFVAWALGFARYKVMEYRNKSYRKPLLLGDDALEALSGAIEEESRGVDERYHALEHCIDRLGDRHQVVLTQRYRHDKTREQIADQLDVKVNTVSVMLRRIRQALAECVGERLGGAAR